MGNLRPFLGPLFFIFIAFSTHWLGLTSFHRGQYRRPDLPGKMPVSKPEAGTQDGRPGSERRPERETLDKTTPSLQQQSAKNDKN